MEQEQADDGVVVHGCGVGECAFGLARGERDQLFCDKVEVVVRLDEARVHVVAQHGKDARTQVLKQVRAERRRRLRGGGRRGARGGVPVVAEARAVVLVVAEVTPAAETPTGLPLLLFLFFASGNSPPTTPTAISSAWSRASAAARQVASMVTSTSFGASELRAKNCFHMSSPTCLARVGGVRRPHGAEAVGLDSSQNRRFSWQCVEIECWPTRCTTLP